MGWKHVQQEGQKGTVPRHRQSRFGAKNVPALWPVSLPGHSARPKVWEGCRQPSQGEELRCDGERGLASCAKRVVEVLGWEAASAAGTDMRASFAFPF